MAPTWQDQTRAVEEQKQVGALKPVARIEARRRKKRLEADQGAAPALHMCSR